MSHLELTDDEWAAIAAHIPQGKRGPKRRHDRQVVTGFLFAAAARVSLESLPLGFPPASLLRTNEAKWRASGALGKIMKAGEPARRRMARQYHDHLCDLSADGQRVTGHATDVLPRWPSYLRSFGR